MRDGRDGLDPRGVWRGRNGDGCQPKRGLTLPHMYPLMSSARWGERVVKKRHAKPLKVPFDQVRQEKKIINNKNGKPRAWIDSKSASDQEKFEERTSLREHRAKETGLYVTSLLNGRLSLSTSGQCFQPLPPQFDAYLSPSSGQGESSPLVVARDREDPNRWHQRPTDLRASTSGVWREGCCLSTGNVQSNLQFHLEKSRFANRSRSRVASCLVVCEDRYADTFFRLVRLYGDL